MIKLTIEGLSYGLFQPWSPNAVGHLRRCCRGPHAALGRRADAHYWIRGAAQLWVLPDQQPLRLRRGTWWVGDVNCAW